MPAGGAEAEATTRLGWGSERAGPGRGAGAGGGRALSPACGAGASAGRRLSSAELAGRGLELPVPGAGPARP